MVLLLFLITSCGKVIEEENSFPQNNATPLEAESLEQALDNVQSDFDKAGITVNVTALRYSVNNLGDSLGICFKESNGKSIGIALSHELFNAMDEDDDEYGLLYKVLLHEIGHCFFNREHDEEYFKVSGYDMMIEIYPEDGLQREDSFQQSLMSELGYFRVPKLLWPYYVKEIARRDRIKTWEDIAVYTDVFIVPYSTTAN